ncbi:NAD(+) diphosphatase [Alloscardovia theropitheci]|uniref:NAD(+) diphosphatase n=1 Tax=Alloscardovia theropitheci TaxID=2496842 RepID=A0A4R0QTB7_9BIFI|nr:NAD(+) diphosphatase [Alloscardovia theropitheci]TCD54485.1 NAD(+) diphosphatase [Alloscardovia theropitheci]
MAIEYFDIPVYTYHRPSLAQAASRTPIVLIHAFPVDHHVWDKAAAELTQQLIDQDLDTSIFAVDMPGAGTNPPAPIDRVGDIASDGAYTEAMDRMASSIVHATQKMGYDKAIYVGISMGGYATLSIARQFPDAVAGLALCDTKPDADTPEQRRNRLAAASRAESEATLEPVIHFAQPHDGDSEFKKSAEFISTFMGWINAQTPSGIAWRQRMAAGRRDEHDTLETITVPVAVISGARDDSSNPRIMRPMAEAMTHASVTFNEIDDAGHFTCFEKPHEVAKALTRLAQEVFEISNDGLDRNSRLQSATNQYPYSFESLRLGQKLDDVPLARGHVDWRIDQRETITESSWGTILSQENSQVILVRNGRVALAKNGIGATVTTGHKRRIATFPGHYMVKALEAYGDCLYFLGEVGETVYIAADLDEMELQSEGKPIDKTSTFITMSSLQFDWLPVRSVAPLLSDNEAQLVVMATGLGMWHRKSRFCGVCGCKNRNINGGWATRCESEEHHVGFPRVEPAMIVRITDKKDRILLQHNLLWEEKVHSVCSGFVEVGESAEHSVHREVREELGIGVTDVHYLGSQPWPFPGSLMLAYSAQADSDEVKIDTRELESARWFTRDELMNALAFGEIELPGASSIALKMIEQWYGAKLR